MVDVIRLPNESIIIAVNDPELTIENMEEQRRAVLALFNEIEEDPVCLIVDTRKTIGSFATTVKLLRSDPNGMRQQISERAFIILVGTDVFVKMFRDAMQQPQFGSATITVFEDIDSAVQAARLYIEREQNQKEV